MANENRKSPKQLLQMVLNGESPDIPPHWELVFQLENKMLNMKTPEQVMEQGKFSSEQARKEAGQKQYNEIQLRIIEEFNWAAIPGGYSSDFFDLNSVKKAVEDKALVPAFEGQGVFWMPSGNDMMNFTVKMFERPDELHAEARQKCEKAKEYFSQSVDQGCDFFLLAYDFGYNKGPFISPEHFKEFVTPYLSEIVEKIHDLGSKAILHCDGDINLLLDQIYSTGVDGYQSVDPQGSMDIKAVREKYPDWILMGNVHCGMLQDTIEDKIRESVQYCMKHGGIGKPYIFSTSNCIFSGMPPESYRVMLDEYKKLCKLK